MRPSALRLTSRILKLTGFSVVRSLNGRAAFPPPSSDFPASGSQRVLCVPGSFTLLWANGCVPVSLCSRSLPETLGCLCVQLPAHSRVHFGPLSGSLLFADMLYLLSLCGSLRFPPLSLQLNIPPTTGSDHLPGFVVLFWISITVLLGVVILHKRQIGGKGVFAYYLLLFKLNVCRLIKLKSIPSGMYQVPGGPIR